MFTIDKNCSTTSARTGKIQTGHGLISTPAFMPIGTYAAIKTVSTDEIKNLNFNLVLSNTYHLYLRPGEELLAQFKGLHNFMNWDGAILTDSGGYQIYSLSDFRKIDNNGVEFRSHLDGSKHYFTPEKIVDIQRTIGSDIMMVLDVCPPADATNAEHLKAVQTTTDWAKRCLNHFRNKGPKYNFDQIISPIVQGGVSEKLRKISAEQLIDLDAQMYAIGGLAVGEKKEDMLAIVNYLDSIMPKAKPRYLMGVGTPEDLINCVSMGIDMFDCVIPTRNGRNGQLFTTNGKINIKNSKFRNDESAIDSNNNSLISKNYSKAYLHHLFKTQEILGYRIATQHNLSFYNNLLINASIAINENKFSLWSTNFLSNYNN
jgi:queuine tRNA-ribosyltransferase